MRNGYGPRKTKKEMDEILGAYYSCRTPQEGFCNKHGISITTLRALIQGVWKESNLKPENNVQRTKGRIKYAKKKAKELSNGNVQTQ